ncbi:MAG: DUF2076 family protein [Betaproteobacteria bacterium]|nr:DUF2076 family protein [Betaproteobacteria bacterium]
MNFSTVAWSMPGLYPSKPSSPRKPIDDSAGNRAAQRISLAAYTGAGHGQRSGGGGGSFLGRAAATAAGVVGGAFLFQGISQLMGNRAHTPESSAQGSTPAASDGLLSNSFASDPAPEANVDGDIPLEQYDTAMDDSAGYDDSSSEA